MTPLAYAVTEDEHRFLSKTTLVGDCWEWTGCRNEKGYGRFSKDGKARFAHRVMYEWFYGPNEAIGLDVDHLCRNRACVNPIHLQAVTHLENTRRSRRDTVWKNAKSK